MKIRGTGLKRIALLCLFFIFGCEGGGGSESALPTPMKGAGGQTIAVVGVANGSAIVCRQAGLGIGSFSVGYTAGQVDSRYRVQLLVEVDKDSAGQTVWGSNRGPYVQSGTASATPASLSGTLSGRIGPPVSDLVRFNLALRLLDASGGVVAVSAPVKGLKPLLQ